MLSSINTFRATVAFSILFCITHLIAAVLLCRERLFLDTAYYFFHVVNEEAFHVEHQRIILILSQLLLWAGVKAHLDLHSLLVLYSITPAVLTSVLLFIALYIFRSVAGAWMLIFCNVCGTYFLYFSPMYEVCYAIVGFGMLWFLTEQGFYKTTFQIAVYTFILTFCLLGYPLIAIGSGALLTFYWVFDRKQPVRLIIIYTAVFLLWFIIKYFFITDYEKRHVTVQADDNKVHEVVALVFSLSYAVQAVVFMFGRYFVVFAAVIIFSITAFIRRQYLQAAWMLSFFIVIMIIVNLKAGGDGLVNTIGNERSYLILVPICLAPLLFRWLPSVSPLLQQLTIAVFVICGIYESAHTWEHSRYFSERNANIDRITEANAAKGCYTVATPFSKLPAGLDEWSTGMEGLVYSSMKGHSVILSDDSLYRAMNSETPIDKDHFLLRLDEVMAKADLNPRYFKLDTSAYCFQ